MKERKDRTNVETEVLANFSRAPSYLTIVRVIDLLRGNKFIFRTSMNRSWCGENLKSRTDVSVVDKLGHVKFLKVCAFFRVVTLYANLDLNTSVVLETS